ncbi:glycosyltransferase [Patescibacteria group bacterium]|nr:glycosyltransferase [Patescibacteria group bacterium]
MKKKKKFDYVSVVIPAFNESKNLKTLVSKIAEMYPLINVVVVDDSDKAENAKSRKIISKISKKFKVVSRFKKQGRGSAVIEGMKLALRNKDTHVVVEMDADLTHDPKELQLFLDSIRSSDMVVGSRYRIGSKIIKWPLFWSTPYIR